VRAMLSASPPIWRMVVVVLLVCVAIGLVGGAVVGTVLARAASLLLSDVVT